MNHSTTLKNIIANYGGKAWGFIAIFLFIPLYIKFLGIESYAVIGFYALILGIVRFVDAGLSSAITRELAKSISVSQKFSTLLIIERIYFLICAGVFFLIFFLSPLIAEKWLIAKTIPPDELILYIRLIGAGVAVELFSAVFFGGLMGLHTQVTANAIQVIWGMAKSVGVIVLFIVYKPTLTVFFVWQLICNVWYIIALRGSLIKYLRRMDRRMTMILNKLPPDVWKYIGGMTFITIISSINTQADKIVTSSLFPLKQFGYYTLASTLSQLPVFLGIPIAVTIFPTFTKLAYESNFKVLLPTFERFSFLLNIIAMTVGIALFMYPQQIMILWTGRQTFDGATVYHLALVIRLLAIGGTFLAMQMMLFYLLIAKGKTRYTIWQGLVQLIFLIPALYFFVKRFGLVGAGIPWAIINLGAFIYLYIVIFKLEVKSDAWHFFRITILYPFLISFSIFAGLYFLSLNIPQTGKVVIIILSGCFSILLNIALYNYSQGRSLLNIKQLLSVELQ